MKICSNVVKKKSIIFQKGRLYRDTSQGTNFIYLCYQFDMSSGYGLVDLAVGNSLGATYEQRVKAILPYLVDVTDEYCLKEV